MAEDLGQIVLSVEADDSGLQKTLKRDEQVVRNAANNMQRDLGKVKAATQSIQAPSGNAAAAIGSISAAAALSGNPIAGMAAQVGNLAIQLKSMLVGAAAPLVALGAAAVVVAGLIAAIWNVQAIADWIEGVGDAEEALKKTNDLLEEKKAKGQDIIKNLGQQLAILKGVNDAYDFKGLDAAQRVEARRLQNAIDSIKAAEEKAKLLATEEAAHQKIVSTLMMEHGILQGTVDKYDLIENLQIRRLTRRNDELRAQQAIVEATEAEANAKQAAFNAQAGPQTGDEASKALLARLDLIKAQERSRQLMVAELEGLVQIGRISQEQADKLATAFGIAEKAAEKLAGGKTGSIAASAFGGGRASFANVSSGGGQDRGIGQRGKLIDLAAAQLEAMRQTALAIKAKKGLN